MSERIQIEGFLVIQQADLELKKINVLIGTQASGKSTSVRAVVEI